MDVCAGRSVAHVVENQASSFQLISSAMFDSWRRRYLYVGTLSSAGRVLLLDQLRKGVATMSMRQDGHC